MAKAAVKPALSFDAVFDAVYAPCPVSQLWDAEFYDGTNPSSTLSQGLAEFTNANFFSSSTIFAAERYADDTSHKHYFPYPKRSSSELYLSPSDIEDGYYKLYFAKKYDGETIDHFVRVGYFSSLVGDLNSEYIADLYLDEACHQDYAAKLVPRAVGYSAALLDYFLRGRLEVKSLPFFYNNELYSMRLKITNTTPSQEPVGNGAFNLVLRYTPEGGADDGSDDIYIKLEEKSFYGELSGGAELELYFNRQDLSVPLDRWDTVRCILVYSGTLGNESYSVVASGFTPSVPIFSEEWDQGLTGNHPWISTPDDANDDNGVSIVNTDYGRLEMENHRFPEFSGPRTNYVSLDLTADNPEGLLMTPETYFQYIIYEMSNIPEDPDASHIVFLKFNNQLALEFSANGPFLPWSAATGFVTFTPGAIMCDNIYSLFDSAGIAVPEPLYLQSIEFLQQIYSSPDPGETQLNISVESIYFLEEKSEEQN